MRFLKGAILSIFRNADFSRAWELSRVVAVSLENKVGIFRGRDLQIRGNREKMELRHRLLLLLRLPRRFI